MKTQRSTIPQKLGLILISLFSIIGLQSAIGQNLQLSWATSAGGTDDDVANKVVVDGSGTVYTTGGFQGVANWENRPLTANGGTDVFIAKQDSLGKVLWAKRIGGKGDDSGSSIALDRFGNIYIIGHFSDSVDFDPGFFGSTLYSLGSTDIFVAKYDVHGNFKWVRQMGGPVNDDGTAIACDVYGNIYTTGYFKGASNFGPITKNSVSGSRDVFVSKLDSSGNFIWTKFVGGSGSDEGRYGIAIDSYQNVHVVGIFRGIVDFDPGTSNYNLSSAGLNDIFVLKLNQNGAFKWARAMGGDSLDYGNSLALDPFGDILVTGFFRSASDFDPDSSSSYTLNSNGGLDIFICKLDSSGHFVWAKQIGGPEDDASYSLAVDGFANVFVAGWFEGDSVDLDPGQLGISLASAYLMDIFVVKLNDLGELQQAIHMPSTAAAYNAGLAIAVQDSCAYVAGRIGAKTFFGPGNMAACLNPVGGFDAFVVKLCDVIPVSVTAQNFASMKVSPNPVNRQHGFFIESPGLRGATVLVDLLTVDGKSVLSRRYRLFPGSDRLHYDVSGVSVGLYFARIRFNGQSLFKKIVIVGDN